jgi:hypothetical protein
MKNFKEKQFLIFPFHIKKTGFAHWNLLIIKGFDLFYKYYEE